jgi:hypothetical protein
MPNNNKKNKKKKIKKTNNLTFKCTNICCQKNFYLKRIKLVYKSIKLNYIFWITSLLSVIIISFYTNSTESLRSKIASGIITFILSMYFGYNIHSLSHTHDACMAYNNKLLKTHPRINKAIVGFLTYTFDFHDKIHHDSSINKQPLNIIIESFLNFMVEGGFILLFTTFIEFNMSFNSYNFKFNRAILFLWAMLYATSHNINYNLSPPIQHTNHHKEYNTNFGIDTLDILFDTKYDIENIEIFNHGAINIIIITFFILYFKIMLT